MLSNNLRKLSNRIANMVNIKTIKDWGEYETMAAQFLQGLISKNLHGGLDEKDMTGNVSIGSWGEVYFYIGSENIYIGLNAMPDNIMIKDNPDGAVEIINDIYNVYLKAEKIGS